MNLTDTQLACLFFFGPLMAFSLAFAAILVAIEIHTQRAARKAWAPVRKGRRHG